MKLLTSENYFSEVSVLFDNEEELDLAVAFWGYDAFELFENSKNKKIRLLCNFQSGACNPCLISKLVELPHVQLKSDSRLHAKLAVQDSLAIIGSANFSANGLSLEGAEQNSWHELGLKVSKSEIIEQSRAWFETMWINAQLISDSDIKKQMENWKVRRSNRPLTKTGQSLIEASLSDGVQLLDRNIFFAVYREYASEEANAEFENMTKESNVIGGTQSFYEDWPELQDNAYLISLYIGPRGGLQFDSLSYMPAKPITKTYIKYDNSESTIRLCALIDDIEGYKLTRKDQLEIKSNIEHITKFEKEKGSAYVIPLYDWINSVKNGI